MTSALVWFCSIGVALVLAALVVIYRGDPALFHEIWWHTGEDDDGP